MGPGNSLEVQWLRFQAFTADSLGLIPGWGTKIPQASLHSPENKKQAHTRRKEKENMSAANSRIRDTDVAQASSEMTRNNILLQASTATLGQANQTSSLALKLIG